MKNSIDLEIKYSKFVLMLFIHLNSILAFAQNGSWQLWASGLPSGVFPKMCISSNHDIYYTLVGTGTSPGVVFKANTQNTQGHFIALPAIPLPPSHQNNVQCIMSNKNNELIAGIFRNDLNDPWLFRFDNTLLQWTTASVNINPALGAFCMASSKNGTLWVGAKWSWVYKSTDDGHSFQQINENTSIKSKYPCYYPSWFNVDNDGAIYGVNVDANNRVYLGTESAGVVFSDDEGLSWQPADAYACQISDPTLKDSNSILKPLNISGNVSGIGFTADNKLIWTGAALWTLGWKNGIACADLKNQLFYPAIGLPDYLVQYGQQISKIVTASNGQVFFHSGTSNGATGIGIYTSMDGIHWNTFNTGITGLNDGQSQGSLAVDSNVVYFATHDGKVWKYEVESIPTKVSNENLPLEFTLYPNPASDNLKVTMNSHISQNLNLCIYNGQYQILKSHKITTLPHLQNIIETDVSSLANGLYFVCLNDNFHFTFQKLIVHHSSH